MRTIFKCYVEGGGHIDFPPTEYPGSVEPGTVIEMNGVKYAITDAPILHRHVPTKIGEQVFDKWERVVEVIKGAKLPDAGGRKNNKTVMKEQR